MVALPAQGTVQAQGAVTVNGARVPGSTTVFAGDKIETASNSTATISAQGTMVQLDPNTSAIFSDKALDLGCGSALVTTSMGAVVRVAGISITPAGQGTTKFRVSQTNGTLKITVEQGSAVVDDGAKHMLSAGQSLTRQRPGGMCGPVATVPQGSTKIYIPAIAVAAVSGIVAYCAVNGFCSQASPSGP
jgi:ferric-dicitrate binding protein FerR (iron transport regulator)